MDRGSEVLHHLGGGASGAAGQRAVRTRPPDGTGSETRPECGHRRTVPPPRMPSLTTPTSSWSRTTRSRSSSPCGRCGSWTPSGHIEVARDGEEALDYPPRSRRVPPPPRRSAAPSRAARPEAAQARRHRGAARAARRATHQLTPVVVLTSSSEPRELAQCYQAGSQQLRSEAGAVRRSSATRHPDARPLLAELQRVSALRRRTGAPAGLPLQLLTPAQRLWNVAIGVRLSSLPRGPRASQIRQPAAVRPT